jgi:hypothetical protein
MLSGKQIKLTTIQHVHKVAGGTYFEVREEFERKFHKPGLTASTF